MFCNKCGANVADGSVLCNVCGNPLNTPTQVNAPQQPVYQQASYQQAVPQQMPYQQPIYQQAAPQQMPYQQPMYPQPGLPLAQPNMPMNWYKFLIYFSLFASAVLNIINGISLLLGTAYETPYGSVRELAYEIFDGLALIEGISMLSCFICAVLAIVARMKLAKYKKYGPKFLQLLYIIAAASNIIAIVGYIAILGDSVGSDVFVTAFSSCIGNVISNIVLIIANKIYFDKRKHLFVN